MTMMAAPNATVGLSTEPTTTPANDAVVLAWTRGARLVSSDVLLQAARDKISRLTKLHAGWDGHRGRPVQPVAAMVLNALLGRLLFDDAASPQIAPMADGGIEVEFLVAGRLLHVEIDRDGSILIVAADETGEEILAGEFEHWAPDFAVVRQAREFLREISGEVEARLAL